ncbi:MAG: DUF1653 domain-containing protein [Asticcacaulis sp.]
MESFRSKDNAPKHDMTDITALPTDLARGLYRHYKGRDYRVLGTARHSETDEILVLYLPLYQEQPQLWVRPLSMFCESVQADTGTVPRFRFISAD